MSIFPSLGIKTQKFFINCTIRKEDLYIEFLLKKKSKYRKQLIILKTFFKRKYQKSFKVGKQLKYYKISLFGV